MCTEESHFDRMGHNWCLHTMLHKKIMAGAKLINRGSNTFSRKIREAIHIRRGGQNHQPGRRCNLNQSHKQSTAQSYSYTIALKPQQVSRQVQWIGSLVTKMTKAKVRVYISLDLTNKYHFSHKPD